MLTQTNMLYVQQVRWWSAKNENVQQIIPNVATSQVPTSCVVKMLLGSGLASNEQVSQRLSLAPMHIQVVDRPSCCTTS